MSLGTALLVQHSLGEVKPPVIKTILAITLISIVITFVVTVAYYIVMPETIPAHFGRDGSVTRHGSRLEVFLMPLTGAFGQGLITLILVASHPYIVVKNPNMSALTAKKVTLTATVLVTAYFSSFSIIALSFKHNAAVQGGEVPLLLIGVVFSAMLATLSSIASGGYRYGFAVIALALLTLGLLQLVDLGILTAIAVAYAGLCCYHFVRHISLPV